MASRSRSISGSTTRTSLSTAASRRSNSLAEDPPAENASRRETSLPMRPMSEILSPPFDASDLEAHIAELCVRENDAIKSAKNNEEFVEKFEEAWRTFLEENPLLVPMGTRERNIDRLQTTIRELHASKSSIEVELKKQAEHLSSSREALEHHAASEMEKAVKEQRLVHEELSKRLENISTAARLQQQTIPWLHFVQELDRVIAERNATNDTSSRGISGMENKSTSSTSEVTPSARALFLTDQSKGDAADIRLRALRMDHALLTTHIRILNKELERYDALTQSQDIVGTFLTEHNIWGILKSTSATHHTIGASRTTHANGESLRQNGVTTEKSAKPATSNNAVS